MSVMHDALGRVGDPIPCYLHGLAPDPSTNHWKPDIETLKVHYEEKSPLIKPHRGSILGPLGLWVGAGMRAPHSTRGYHFIVVVFILNTHYLLCPTLYECDA